MKSPLVWAVLLLAACGGGAGSADAGIVADAEGQSGTFVATWTLVDGAAAVTCDQVGATLVRFSFVPTNGSLGFVGVFDCSAGMGTSEPHDVGSYNVSVELKNGAGQVLSSQSLGSQALVAAQATTLAPITFDVKRTGGMTAKLDVPGTVGPNCTDEPTGAGLTKVRLELRNAQGTCVPTQFEVAAGASNGAQTIAAGCPGALSNCIENDQTVSASGIAAGSYQLAVEGFEHGSTTQACYSSTTQVTISGGDQVTNLGTVNLPINPDADAGCVAP